MHCAWLKTLYGELNCNGGIAVKSSVSCKEHGTPIARHVMIVACAFALFAPVTQGHAQGFAHDIGDIGGTGGGSFRSQCRANQTGVIVPGDVIIGFNMRSGAALDAIVPICISVNERGTEWKGEAYEPTPYIGGAGGGFQKIACQPGYAVRHLHVFAGPSANINIVKHIRMTCQKLDSGLWYDVSPNQIGGTVTGDQRYSCPAGEWGAGIYGKAGAFIDRLGFSCAFMPPF
jgi:hypothetical protein